MIRHGWVMAQTYWISKTGSTCYLDKSLESSLIIPQQPPLKLVVEFWRMCRPLFQCSTFIAPFGDRTVFCFHFLWFETQSTRRDLFWMAADSGASAWDCWWWLLAPTAGRRWTWCHRSHLGFIGWQKFDWGVGRVCYGAGNLWVRCKTWKMEVSWSLELVLRPFWGTEILLVGGSQTPFFGGHIGGQQLWTQFFMGDLRVISTPMWPRPRGGILSPSEGGLPRWFFQRFKSHTLANFT